MGIKDAFSGLTKTFFLALFLGIGGFLYGFDSGIITPTLVQKRFVSYFGEPDADLRGAIVSIYQGGAWIGSALVGITGDRLGRRKGVAVGAAVGIVGGILMTAAAHVSMLIIGRLCVGFAVGTMTGIAPVFGAEIAKTHERARITAVNQMMVAWGFFVANWTGYGSKFIQNSGQWRVGFSIQAIPAIVLFCGVWFIPESPRWLLLKGREEEAEQSFRRLHGGNSTEEYLNDEFQTMRNAIRAEIAEQRNTSWGTLLSIPSFRKRLFIGCFVWAAAMLSGISFVQYYQPFIYKALSFNNDQQLLVTGLYGSVAPVACIISLFVVDKVGRRPILVTSSSLLCVSYVIITALSAKFDPKSIKVGEATNDNALRTIVGFIFLISANYSALLGPMTWIIPPEVFTTELRAKANSIVQVIHYSFSIVITQVSPKALERVGWKYYIFFCLTNALCAAVFYFVYPETKGRSLEEIDLIFGDVKNVEQALESGHGRETPTDAEKIKDSRESV